MGALRCFEEALQKVTLLLHFLLCLCELMRC